MAKESIDGHLVAQVLISLGLLAMLIGAAVCGSGCSEDLSVKVTSRTWTHTTSLRERQIVQDGTFWSVPRRAGHYDEPTFNKHCYMRQNGTYCAHYDNNHNCMVRVPDYDEYCEYSYYDWPIIASKYIAGENHPGSWPTYSPDLENFRESRSATYFVHFVTGNNRAFVYKTSDVARYSDFKIGDLWQIERSKLTDKIEPVKRLTFEAENVAEAR